MVAQYIPAGATASFAFFLICCINIIYQLVLRFRSLSFVFVFVLNTGIVNLTMVYVVTLFPFCTGNFFFSSSVAMRKIREKKNLFAESASLAI